MKTFLIIILIACATVGRSETVNPKLIKAIHMVETGGRYGRIYGDHGRALGPLQIHYKYWKDSGVTGSYSQVANYDYAVKVVSAYLARYASKAVATNDFATLAMVHNAGPSGMHKRAAKSYWKKVSQFI